MKETWEIYIPEPIKVKPPDQEPTRHIDPIEGMIRTMVKGTAIFLTLLLGYCWIVARFYGG